MDGALEHITCGTAGFVRLFGGGRNPRRTSIPRTAPSDRIVSRAILRNFFPSFLYSATTSRISLGVHAREERRAGGDGLDCSAGVGLSNGASGVVVAGLVVGARGGDSESGAQLYPVPSTSEIP